MCVETAQPSTHREGRSNRPVTPVTQETDYFPLGKYIVRSSTYVPHDPTESVRGSEGRTARRVFSVARPLGHLIPGVSPFYRSPVKSYWS